jgi:Flp pilus assembly protein TadG
MMNKSLKISEKGQSFVEMATILPILIVLFAGLIDAGRIFFSYVALRDAAQEGVNYGIYGYSQFAATNDLTGFSNQVMNRVRTTSDAPVDLSNTANVSVVVTKDGVNSFSASDRPCTGKTITVRVTYQFQIDAPLFGAIVGSQSFPLSGIANGTVVSPGCH